MLKKSNPVGPLVCIFSNKRCFFAYDASVVCMHSIWNYFRLTSAGRSTSTRSCGSFSSSIGPSSIRDTASRDGRSEKSHRKSDSSTIITSKITFTIISSEKTVAVINTKTTSRYKHYLFYVFFLCNSKKLFSFQVIEINREWPTFLQISAKISIKNIVVPKNLNFLHYTYLARSFNSWFTWN